MIAVTGGSVSQVLSEDVRLSIYFRFKALNILQHNMSRIFKIVIYCLWTWENLLSIKPPLINGKLMPVLYDQVTKCLGSLTFSLVSTTSMNDIQTIQDKRILECTCPWHSMCELSHMHTFLPKTDWKIRIWSFFKTLMQGHIQRFFRDTVSWNGNFPFTNTMVAWG